MTSNEFNDDDLGEIDRLATRSRKFTRRDLIKAGRTSAFAIPALAVFALPIPAHGQTDTGSKDP